MNKLYSPLENPTDKIQNYAGKSRLSLTVPQSGISLSRLDFASETENVGVTVTTCIRKATGSN
jgi:hypothetical protein